MQKNNALLILSLCIGVTCAPALSGELWEITSSSIGPDGVAMPLTQKQCLPNNGMNPSAVLAGMGQCVFDQKNGNASAMAFTMTCKTPNMPQGLDAMKIVGDAKMSADRFDLRYTIAIAGSAVQQSGGDFKMSGSAQAKKLGKCTEY
ncbi:DUF3617 family protein [uncultured Deefgea sp.]|uniref:DUF3617 domain-containing protein n=1 Tax=uncultured Deefgea sp. TaxID=1304914 RepID=UPI00260960B2|nr:DUF3617 family protein [uncultured Deefgea sp.]